MGLFTVKISQKRYSAAGINFLQPLSASYSKQEKLISAVLDVSILLFPDYILNTVMRHAISLIGIYKYL